MMKVDLIPAFQDNYLFGLAAASKAMVVDPGSAPEIFQYLADENLQLETILLTHHHGDHIGGAEELRKATGAKILGPEDLPKFGVIPDQVLRDGDRLSLQGVEFEVMAVPGHTLDHLAYFSAANEILFCGDTVFSLGCGRLFEGTFAQMFESLGKIRALPKSTRVYCAHEYTVNNARFSLKYVTDTKAGDPTVLKYQKLLEGLQQWRAQGRSTVPSTLAFELEHNLFLKAATVEEFTKVRQARNQF